MTSPPSCSPLTVRLALVVVALVALFPAAAVAGDGGGHVLAAEPPVEHLDAAGGALTWAHARVGSSPALMRALDGRAARARRVPAYSEPGDLGTDRAGRPVLSLRRCGARGCRWWLYDVRASRASVSPRLEPRGCRITALSIWQGDFAWATSCRRTRDAGIYLRSRSQTRRLIGWGARYGRCCRDGAIRVVRTLDLGRRGVAVGSLDWSSGESEDESGVHFLARRPGGCHRHVAYGFSGPSTGATVGSQPRISGSRVFWWHSGSGDADPGGLRALDVITACRTQAPRMPDKIADAGPEFAVDGSALFVARAEGIVRLTLRRPHTHPA